MPDPEQKCCMPDCGNRGVPTDGYTFFFCEECQDKPLTEERRATLEREINRMYERHGDN